MSYTLEEVQKRMDAKGVRDVKIFFHETAFRLPVDVVKQDVANVLGSYLDGRFRVASCHGDSKMAAHQ